MAVRQTLALKVLFSCVNPTLSVGNVSIMTSNHNSIKYKSKASIFTVLFIILWADSSRMTATHNNSKPAQIWMESAACVMTSCVPCWRWRPAVVRLSCHMMATKHRLCAGYLHSLWRLLAEHAGLHKGVILFIYSSEKPYQLEPNCQGKLCCKVEFSDLLQHYTHRPTHNISYLHFMWK